MRDDVQLQVPVAVALFYGGPIAMHVFKQDAVVSAVSSCPHVYGSNCAM